MSEVNNIPIYLGVAKKDIMLNDFQFRKDTPYQFYIKDIKAPVMEAYFLGDSVPFRIDNTMFELEPYEPKELSREELAARLNVTYSRPTNEEREQTISFIRTRLDYKPINRHTNAGVKEGYLKAVEVLEKKQTDFNNVDVSGMKTTQGRAIVAMAIDYLNGLCKAETLIGVPIIDKP